MFATIAALALATAASAGAGSARIEAVAVSGPNAVRASGELSDDAWQGVVPVDAFVQNDQLQPARRVELRR